MLFSILNSIQNFIFETHFRYPFFDSMTQRRLPPNSQVETHSKQIPSQAQNFLKSNILAQTLVLAQQPHISVHLPLQTVKAEAYDGLARKVSFSLSQKGLSHLNHSSKHWERGNYHEKRERVSDDDIDR